MLDHGMLKSLNNITAWTNNRTGLAADDLPPQRGGLVRPRERPLVQAQSLPHLTKASLCPLCGQILCPTGTPQSSSAVDRTSGQDAQLAMGKSKPRGIRTSIDILVSQTAKSAFASSTSSPNSRAYTQVEQTPILRESYFRLLNNFLEQSRNVQRLAKITFASSTSSLNTHLSRATSYT